MSMTKIAPHARPRKQTDSKTKETTAVVIDSLDISPVPALTDEPTHEAHASHLDFMETPELKNSRQRVKLERLEGERNRLNEIDTLTLWYDTASTLTDDDRSVLERVVNLRYTGVVLYPSNVERLGAMVPARMKKIIQVDDLRELEMVSQLPLFAAAKDRSTGHKLVIASKNLDILSSLRLQGVPTCYRAHVDDAASLHESIASGCRHDYLMIRFRDPTNIPLELVIASLQATKTILIKEISSPLDVDDAIVSLGVMEVGADGIAFSPRDHGCLDEVMRRLDPLVAESMPIESAVIIGTRPVGMGYRSCIDVAGLFSPTEGMIVGSTSQGGILCCPEVFFLPYMDLRPFRVNAGAVHSYVYNTDNRTNYMTELSAGSPIAMVSTTGQIRRGCVGRMKTEVRPLRVIEAEFASGERINTIMQDDWHVRIFSEQGLPLNITELKPGDRILGHRASPGRHVGIKVDEHIIES